MTGAHAAGRHRRSWIRLRAAVGLALAAALAGAAAVSRGATAQSSPAGTAAQQGVSVRVSPPVAISPGALPAATAGVAYSTTPTAAGGTPPYTWTLTPGSGRLPPGFTLDAATGTISGTTSAQGAYVITVGVTDSSSPAPRTGRTVFDLLVNASGAQPAVATVATSSRPTGCLDVGSGGAATTAQGCGRGTMAVADYPPGADPTPAAPPQDTGRFFDVALAPQSRFQTVEITQCRVPPDGAVVWWTGTAWQRASDQGPGAPGCLVVTVSATTSPDLAELTGTAFSVVAPAGSAGGGGGTAPAAGGGGGAPPSGSGGAATGPTSSAAAAAGPSKPTTAAAASTVGSLGGTLATADGAFSLPVPAGVLAPGSALRVGESCTLPRGIPPGLVPAGCVFTLSGTPLRTPEAATVRFAAAALNRRSPLRLSVYAAGRQGWHFLPTAVDAAAGTVSAWVHAPSRLAVLGSRRVFPDLPAGDWARPAVDALLGAGLVRGFPDGTFRPSAPVTRAQFVAMLMAMLGPEPPARGGAAPSFADVPATAWFAPAVRGAAEAGLVDGVGAGRFEPDAPLSRQQAAVMLTRALSLPDGPPTDFRDRASVAPWAAASVRAAVASGLIRGFPDGTFRPDAQATRAEAAAMLARALARLAP